MRELKDYKKYKILTKDDDNGSHEIFGEFFKTHFAPCNITKKMHKHKVRVVGVNTQFCVFLTAQNLAQYLLFTVSIILSACYTDEPVKNWDNFKKKCKSYNIKVI